MGPRLCRIRRHHQQLQPADDARSPRHVSWMRAAWEGVMGPVFLRSSSFFCYDSRLSLGVLRYHTAACGTRARTDGSQTRARLLDQMEVCLSEVFDRPPSTASGEAPRGAHRSR